jgi:hypothetical protein
MIPSIAPTSHITHVLKSCAFPGKTGGNLFLFGVIRRKLDIKLFAFVDSINNPPDAGINLRMRHSMSQINVVGTSARKII